ncbi:acyl-[acyl-carrier-protein]--UDP-N-acetylglucosamine O-acyltransferase [Comamonas serinivorans]|uniref:Acyl-[acyl-carrier-protein]--UDP-N-acetylglucosamine O-acyltransferase n=1 Tax=Comamonas serinivorans TaxID=1082851 RepID=A0A1Y0ERA1_9BURK|nr:acyl-ACP--UDP-N-acetylglucosamine O-acyltransferase [Comamonas serinivorans]ARU05782.1 acyl-[acyl-carrier-protein]--UDP-N-acetylglucosamine O-acyltransferase [Comamonas serinivorans]
MTHAKIHPTALVDARAELDSSVEVGPYAVIGPHVQMGAGCSVGPHACIEGHTRIGQNNRFFQFVSIGAAPQDKKYAGEPTRLEIGNDNTFREFVTINTGTTQDQGITRLGDDNWIMAYVHVAHDCQLGSHIILANAVQLAGHVHLGDWVFLGGQTGVHQFVRVGAHAMAAFQTRLPQDVPPFMTVGGNPVAAHGVNAEGLRRRGFSPERIANVKHMQRLLYRQGLALEAVRGQLDALRDEVHDADMQADVHLMQAFLQEATRGIVR